MTLTAIAAAIIAVGTEALLLARLEAALVAVLVVTGTVAALTGLVATLTLTAVIAVAASRLAILALRLTVVALALTGLIATLTAVAGSWTVAALAVLARLQSGAEALGTEAALVG